MQTISCYFLKQELPEIRQVVTTLKEIEIIDELEIPHSDLVHVSFLLSDASMLYTIGLLVQNNRVQLMVNKNLKV